MRVLALGAGGMGRRAALTARGFDFVERLVVADRDPAAARSLAAEVDGEPRTLDVTDGPALRTALAEVDVVMTTVGPYFRFGLPILEAAIDVGRHYLDICDDWEPTLQMLELDGRAREAGISAVIGLGATPGLSNLMAAQAIGELDQAERVYTGWSLTAAQPEGEGPRPSAATVHGMHQLTGTIRIWRDGGLREVRPQETLHLDYPGIGRGRVRSIGHPEAVTLPRTFPGLRECVNVMHGSRLELAATRVITGCIDRGLLSLRRAAHVAELLESAPLDADAQIERMLRGGGLPPLFALAVGTRGGRPASVGAMLTGTPGGMAGTTAVPLACGLALLHGGKLRGPGVMAPEAALEPADFYEVFAPFCGRRPGELALLTRSWEDGTVAARLAELVR